MDDNDVQLPDTSQHRPTVQLVLHLAVLASAIAFIYARSLRNGFVWDDEILFIGRDYYTSFDLFKIIFVPGNGLEYLPLRDLTYIIDHALWDKNPVGYHLSNLIIFTLTVFVIYIFSRELIHFLRIRDQKVRSALSPSQEALCIALLFAVHPLQSQAVNFISCRNVLLSGMFLFLSLRLFLLFIQRSDPLHSGQHYLSSLLCFQLALLSKATVIIVPFILVLLIAFGPRTNRKAQVMAVLPFLALALFFILLFYKVATEAKVIRTDLHEFGIYSYWSKLAKAVQIPFFYLSKAFVPKGFSAEYNIDFIKSFFHPIVLIAAIALIACIILSWRYRRSNPVIIFGMLWIMITLLPVMNLFPTKPVVADRYVFLPFWGLSFIVVSTVSRVTPYRYRRGMLIVGCVLLLSLSYISRDQCRIWASDITLWDDALVQSPNFPKAYVNLGYAYLAKQDRVKAYALFKKAKEIDPSYADYEYILGMNAFSVKDYRTAIVMLDKVLERRPGYHRALYLIGMAHEKSGDLVSALGSYNKIFDSPEYDLNNYRSKSLLRINVFIMPRLAPALDTLRKSVTENPRDIKARAHLAEVLYEYGLNDEAFLHFSVLAMGGSHDPSFFRRLGEIMRREGRLQESIKYFTTGLAASNGSDCASWNSIGIVYNKMKDHARALEAFRQAVDRNARCIEAEFNLALLHFQLGNKRDALYYFREVERHDHSMRYDTESYLRTLQ